MTHFSCRHDAGTALAARGGIIPAVKRIAVLAGLALAVAGCGEAQETAEELRAQTDAAVDAQGVVNAIRSSVDAQSIEGAIKGAAAGAIREELGAVGAVVDEDALVSGIDKAIDGQAVTGAIGQAARDAVGVPASSVEE